MTKEEGSLAENEALMVKQLIKDGRASLNLKLTVAEGKLPLKLGELLDLLLILKEDHHPQVKEAIIKSARSLPQKELIDLMDFTIISPEMLDFLARVSLGRDLILQRIVLDSSTLDTTIEYLANFANEELLKLIASDKLRIRRHPAILEAVFNNKNVSPLVKEALLKEEETSAQQRAKAEEYSSKNLLLRISKLNVSQKIMLSLKGSWQERVILLRDRNKQVASTVLKSPKLNEKEVEMISKMRNVSEEILRELAEERRWTGKYAIIRNLVENPKTPVSQSLSFVSRLSTMDLRRIKSNPDIPEPIRKLGKNILDKRTAPAQRHYGKH